MSTPGWMGLPPEFGLHPDSRKNLPEDFLVLALYGVNYTFTYSILSKLYSKLFIIIKNMKINWSQLIYLFIKSAIIMTCLPSVENDT